MNAVGSHLRALVMNQSAWLHIHFWHVPLPRHRRGVGGQLYLARLWILPEIQRY